MAEAILAFLLLYSPEPGMVFIPGGSFQQGRTFDWPDAKLKWYPAADQDDLPVHTVQVAPFYMDESEVTNERYAKFAKARKHRTPYQWRNGQFPEGQEKLPVVNVSWDDAAGFCAWEGKRLPTESEWERAARGPTDGLMYPWGNQDAKPAGARYGSEGPLAVCSKTRNAFGLCDMIGNVWEWCSDWYERTYYAAAPERDPRGPEKGKYRVLRGGSWFDQPPLFLTNSYRSWARPAERSATIGFRCARNFASPGGVSSPLGR